MTPQNFSRWLGLTARPVFGQSQRLGLLAFVVVLIQVTGLESALAQVYMAPPDDKVQKALQRHWEEFPLIGEVDFDRPVSVDPDLHFLPQDGMRGSDGWRRLMLNVTPIMIDGRRYGGFRFRALTSQDQDLYMAFRMQRPLAHWYITAPQGNLTGLDTYYSVRAFPRPGDTFTTLVLPGRHLVHNKNYLFWIEFTDDTPFELAVRYEFRGPNDWYGYYIKGMSPPHTVAEATGFNLSSKVLTQIPTKRRALGIVLNESRNRLPIIAGVIPNSPADLAGIKPGDTLVDLPETEVSRFKHVNLFVYEQNLLDDELTLTIAPAGSKEIKQVNLQIKEVEIKHLRIFNALGHGLDDYFSPSTSFTPSVTDTQLIYLKGMELLDSDDPASHALAVKWLEHAVYYNNAKAILVMARLYDTGVGVQKDHARAFELLKFAESKNLAYDDSQTRVDIHYQLSRHYREGLGVKISHFYADDHLRQAERYGAPELSYELGMQGLDIYPRTEMDDAVAASHFRTAHRFGHPDAAYQEGLILSRHYTTQKQDKAAEAFMKAAQINHPQAMVELGKFYELGRGVDQDDQQAVRWYRKALSLGNPEAAQRLGLLYQQGRGVPVDEARGDALIQLAREHGVIEIVELPEAPLPPIPTLRNFIKPQMPAPLPAPRPRQLPLNYLQTE